MKPLIVIGCSGDGSVSAAARAVLSRARRIAGSQRLLAAVASPENAEKVPLGADLAQVLPTLAGHEWVILASGDPLYCGIGGTLKRLNLAAEFYPAPTAFQECFARLGEPWEDAALFSLHGKRNLPFRSLLRAEKSVIYGDATRTPDLIAAELIAAFPQAASRRAAAARDLGLPGEAIVRGTLAELAADARLRHSSLGMLVLLPDADAVYPAPPLGLPDDNYSHSKNMITHPEVRAVAVAKLRPAPGVMWDLGAGSGSVALECAGLCPGLRVYAVERNEERFDQLCANVAREGLENVECRMGDSASVVGELPAPDRIFIGGGGARVLDEALARLRPGGILVMTAVTAESGALLLGSAYTELLTINVSRAEPLGKGAVMRAENPITIAVFQKTEVRQ